MESVCTRCGKVCAEPGARFCPECGGMLEQRQRASGAAPSEPAPPPQPAVPQPPADPALGGELAGARCAAHPTVPARNVCSRCGNFACGQCVRQAPDGKALCASCAQRVHLGTWDIPWEKREQLGMFRAYWLTAKEGAFAPDKTYQGLAPTGQFWDAMSFAIVSTALGFVGTLVLYGVVGLIAGIVGAKELSENTSGAMIAGIAVGVIVGIAVFIPIYAIMRVFICAGIDHLGLLIAGGGKAGYWATFRGYCYGMSPAMFGVIPACGVYIWEIWRIACQILAYKSVHQMSGGRAAAAVLIPFGLCCVGYIGLVVFAQIFAH
ncbi:MAG: YIP1 family protein [Deltaproteobacteria bacterium]|nr:YIP1 family protein [Deltaproteobacteria bacterium]